MAGVAGVACTDSAGSSQRNPWLMLGGPHHGCAASPGTDDVVQFHPKETLG